MAYVFVSGFNLHYVQCNLLFWAYISPSHKVISEKLHYHCYSWLFITQLWVCYWTQYVGRCFDADCFTEWYMTLYICAANLMLNKWLLFVHGGMWYCRINFILVLNNSLNVAFVIFNGYVSVNILHFIMKLCWICIVSNVLTRYSTNTMNSRSSSMQGRYKKNSIIVRKTVVEFSAEFPVSVVYKHKNAGLDCGPVHEHVWPLPQHVVSDPRKQSLHSPRRIARLRQCHPVVFNATKQQLRTTTEF